MVYLIIQLIFFLFNQDFVYSRDIYCKTLIMSNTNHLKIKMFYQKQIKDGVLTLRLDQRTNDRLFKICNATSRTKSDIIRDALWKLINSDFKDLI